MENVFLFIFLISVAWVLISSVPSGFSDSTLIEIEEGESLKQVSQKMKDSNLIRSRTLFSSIIILSGNDDSIVAGEYLFEKPETVFQIAGRVTGGDYGIKAKAVTLKEGFTLNQMANILEEEFPNFDRTEFEIETSLHEGYYFPDTYNFPENADTALIVEALSINFKEKIESISEIIDSSDKTLEQIIIMASIIEKEATKESRQEISNILWKRMEIGMALQVDAPFVYERGKGSFDLSTRDLKTDSPYNTYTNAGLPPTAIANPGLESIKAAAGPQPTDYLFFLTGNDGEMYYAETHDGHVTNKKKYLN